MLSAYSYQISVECEEYRGRERVEKGVGERGYSMAKKEETNGYVVFKRAIGKQRREISVLSCTTHLVTGQTQFQDRRKRKLVACWIGPKGKNFALPMK